MEPEENWPENKVEKVKSAESEIKTSESSITCNNSVFLEILKRGISYPQIPNKEWRLSPERFSKWLKFLRVFAWVYRFLTNCCSEKNQRSSGELSTFEIEDIESIAIRKAQSDTFREEIHSVASGIQLSRKSRLVSLNPVLDEDGILRSDSRLKYAEFLPYNVRYPIILQRKHWITKLIIKHYHEKGFHVAGTNQTLADLSSKYWIVSGREAIREWENQCMECRRRKGKPVSQIMSPLPEIRLRKPLKAFAQVAVDFGGPYITIQGRGKRREKRYLCLFTCLNSRAVHLEMAFGLDTSSFMNAFYRMVNRRGLPIEVLSDNGTNFVEANRELLELVSALNEDQISNNVANHGIKWHFNPPLAPHFGGVHETMIKSAKRAIDAILGNADKTDEELITTFTGAEALLNSRPLTYQSANPADIVPLTPNHFLHGQAGGVFAPDTVDTTSFSLRNRWRRLQELIRHFWKR